MAEQLIVHTILVDAISSTLRSSVLPVTPVSGGSNTFCPPQALDWHKNSHAHTHTHIIKK